jgi:hypothetical protein
MTSPTAEGYGDLDRRYALMALEDARLRSLKEYSQSRESRRWSRRWEQMRVLSRLARLWWSHPELRFGQLVAHLTPLVGFEGDPFHVPDQHYLQVARKL